MANYAKKFVSALLCFSMLLSLAPSCFAAEASANGERSYFDFEATEYEVNENDGELKIKVVRHGDGSAEADVAFKVADFLSSYGEDYEVLDAKGNPLPKVYGEKPSVSDFKYEGDTEELVDVSTAASENKQSDEAEETTSDEENALPAEDAGDEDENVVPAETVEQINTEKVETGDVTEEDMQAESIGEAELAHEDIIPAEDPVAGESVETENAAVTDDKTQLPENTNKKRKSTGSSLRDAQAAYLNITENEEDKETESAVKETLDDMYNYFLAAEGASGVVHFKKGEQEKTITVRVFDNDAAEQNKIFMIALMGTDNDETMTAANATTYVTIIDDEAAERAQFDLSDDGLTLTKDASEGYITVRRSGGTQYFATVYVSTVKDTADAGSYENFEYKPVAFVPGETEKKVKVTATDFSKDGKFGIRLEGETSVDIGDYYITVNISADGETALLSEDSNTGLASEDSVSLMASNVTLGSSSWNADIWIPGGWKKDITGDGSAWESGGYLHIKQYDKNDHTMYVSNNKLNLIGNKDITFSSYVTNVSRGFGSKYQSYDTYFETDSDQSFPGSLNSIHIRGNSNWTERTLGLGSTGDSAYLKFSTRPTSGGYDNSEAILDWVRFNYAKYTFSPQNSAETFSRKVYDFSQGTPNVYDTYYDGETNRVYNPGSVVIKRNSDTVSAFYGNNGETVTITAANESKNKSKGIYLKGVYFAKDNINANSLYLSGKYTTKNVYYVSASNGKVTFTPNQNFIKTLRDKGVISGVHEDATFKVFPVFAQEQVEIHFENADRDDSKAATKGKFNETNKSSYIINVLEACNKGTVKKGFYANWLDYYYMTVPKYSVIRVQTQPISTRIANGVNWWSFDGKRSGVTYHKENDKIASGTNASGETVVKTDYTKADIIASEGISMKPATGTQTFSVGYFPTEKGSVPDVYKSENGLTNAVVPSDSITSGSTAAANGTDKNGKYVFKNPFIGMDWSLTAIAPEGYYTQWVNMTGDANEDGYISATEASKIRNKSSMPDEVYGNVLSGKLDQDNFLLNYYFLPKTSAGNGKKTGTVVRAPENFYQLAKNIKSNKSDIPVVAAYVDVGGFIGQTDGNGRYSIICNDLPSAGNVSTTVTADGASYSTISKLQRDTYIKLDALSKFKATGLDAYYSKTSGAIAEDFITINDDTLTIATSVTSDSAIVPEKARFFIYDSSGMVKYALEGKDGYTTSVERNGNELTAYLKFNPKKDMTRGDKIYVQFADQNGEWTNTIDLGYYFSAKLDLAEFIFPLIGSSSLENALTTGFVADIIGDPLGGIDLGTIKGFEETSTTYTPSGINKNDIQNYTWQQTSYHFGWSDEFYKSTKKTNEDKDEEKLAKYLKAIYDGKSKGEEPPTPGKYATKSRFKWSITPSVGFNLTLSSRKDGNTYFEDLVFYAKIDFNVSASQQIQLPIGISVLIKGSIGGNVAGIYHMYVDYKDSYETEDAVQYTSEDFGLFKKFNNSVRREGYIFVNPKISVALGVGYGVVFVTGNASFAFDMDFQFTEIGTNAYGDITIDLGWGIQLFNFEVYSKSLYDITYKLFNTEGTDGHIEFDYNDASTLSLLSVADFFSADGDEELVLDRPSSREYLANRSEWLGEDNNVSLMSIDASEGTAEKTLMEGMLESPYVKLAELDGGKILCVFICDDDSRSIVNKRALHYMIYDGSGNWSEPQLVDNDGTLDDYPNLSDLGDGRILVTWSSADKELENGATVEDALKSMNIKAAFFKKDSCTFGNVMQVTKTTDGDYCADTMANAAYDETTQKLILYYTKTEYDGLEKVDDISNAYSANAYMFYDDSTGTWSSADDYTEEELEGQEDKDQYKKDWYGQRFLDVRISKNGKLPRVIDTTSINYNGLALFAWTVDWDNDLNTLNDRDVFMQIYNFGENSFTHIIRVTAESAAYTTPKFARSDNATYLFYGETKAVESGSGTETELAEHGAIKYLNVSDLIKNNRFTEINDGGSEYYVFRYERETYSLNENDNTSEIMQTETVFAQAGTAAECDNPMDYDVKVSSDGQMYLFWTDAIDGARQIMTAMYNAGDENDDDETAEENKSGADLSADFWSEPVQLTSAAEGKYYSGIGATAVGGKLIAVSAKGEYAHKGLTSFVNVTHTPFAKVKATSVELIDETPQPLSTVTLRATVKNEGLLKKEASEDAPIKVAFTVNGGDPVYAEITKPIPGGTAVSVECSVTLPEDLSNVEFGAYTSDEDKVTAKFEQKSDVNLTDNKIERIASDGYNPEKVVYSAVLTNDGNADMTGITFTAKVGETEVGKIDIEALAANETQNVEIELSIPDSAYVLNEDGLGSAEVSVNAVSNGETVSGYTGSIQKTFSAEAIEALSKVTEIKFSNNGTYSMKLNEKKDIQPTITGADENSLMVMWLESSDSDIAHINYDNMIVADSKGTATLTGIVVPSEEKIEFISGAVQNTDWKELIPADKLVTVTAAVNVSESGSSGRSSGGGSSAKTQYTLTLDAANGSESGTIKVNKDGTVSELPTPVKSGYKFEGWYSDEALTVPFTTETKVTSDLKLYAKWTEETKEITTPDTGKNETPFKDIAATDWFYDAVKYVYENKLFSGVADDKFAPNDSLTRAMLVTVLWRAENMPESDFEVSFNDIETDGYYAEALRWAASEGIVEGISETEFAPNDNITREQIAAIMFRYAKLKGNVPEGEWAVSLEYNDAGDISDWAVEAVMFCKLKGIMLGDDANAFNPKNNATRAETAAIAQRFLESLNNN